MEESYNKIFYNQSEPLTKQKNENLLKLYYILKSKLLDYNFHKNNPKYTAAILETMKKINEELLKN